MLTRVHKILIGVLAVQLALAAFVLTRGDDTRVRKSEPLLPGFDAAKVQKLAVYDANDAKKPAVELRKDGARWVVASAFVSDDILRTAQAMDSDLALANVELVHNAVDWTLADDDLLAIRSRDASARALTVEPDQRDTWRTVNIVIAVVLLALVVAAAWLRRRAVSPVEVV